MASRLDYEAYTTVKGGESAQKIMKGKQAGVTVDKHCKHATMMLNQSSLNEWPHPLIVGLAYKPLPRGAVLISRSSYGHKL